MNNFDFSLYDPEDDSEPVRSPEPKAVEKPKKADFDFSKYDDSQSASDDSEKPSSDGLMSFLESVHGEHKRISKSFWSSLSFGVTERIPGLDVKPGEESLVGEIVGSAVPLGAGLKALYKGLNFIPKIYRHTRSALGVLGAGFIGGANEAAHQVGRGEEFNKEKIFESAQNFALFDLVLGAIPGGYRWLKNLKPSAQEDLILKNLIPENMPPTDYKLLQDEIVPKLQQVGEAEYEQLYKTAVQDNDRVFQQELANVKGKHEGDLQKIEELKSEHAAKAQEIEQANQQAIAEYQQSKIEWEQQKTRQAMVEEAIDSVAQRPEAEGIEFEATQGGEDVGVRPQPIQIAPTSLENRVGNLISETPIRNETVAGQESVGAVRATAKADYNNVRDLYKVNDKLNESVVQSHEDLSTQLTEIIDDLNLKGNLTAYEQKIKANAQKTLSGLVQTDNAGNVIGFNDVSNNFILDQAKALRNSMYYDFAEGNPTKIFNPLINLYQEAANGAASAVGNEAAIQANNAARAANANWFRTYNQPYIRRFRNTNLHKDTALYKSALDIDNFTQLNEVLGRTNAGQNLSAQIRRELVNKKLAKFYENPARVNPAEFNTALDNLSTVLQPGEAESIRAAFRQARATRHIPAKQAAGVKEPKPPALKEVPKSKVKEPTSVKIPTKKAVTETPEMKKAAKLMNITPEQVNKLGNTPSGIKYLRKRLDTQEGKKLFEEFSKNKIKKILYEGNTEKVFKGTELYDLINKGENFDLLSELIGEEATLELRSASREIGKSNVTKKAISKVAKKAALVHSLSLLGIL